MRPWIPAALLGVLTLAACGDDDVDDPAAARDFLGQLQAQQYRTWSRATGWEARKKSIAAHGNEADIYVNTTLGETPAGATAWPDGSVIVKDSFRDGDLSLIAAMEKRPDGWYYAEWSADGTPKYAGRPSICTDCHDNGVDQVLAFTFPK
ncbi:MAG: hypothetical protein EOO75_00980 [Myxococcales bacterium]|nr:MAG: hypothetical protein EOO75_00980 [Myxococcales bacterium]